MTFDKLILLVKELRESQKMYDRTKHPIYFSQLKSAEKTIDIFIAAHDEKVREFASPSFSFSETDPKPHGY